MRTSSLLAIIVLLSMRIGCAQRAFDPSQEGVRLLRRDAEWADLATAGKDVDKIVSYFTNDVLFISPGQPENPVFSPDGKLAYLRGTSEITRPGPKGSMVDSHLP